MNLSPADVEAIAEAVVRRLRPARGGFGRVEYPTRPPKREPQHTLAERWLNPGQAQETWTDDQLREATWRRTPQTEFGRCHGAKRSAVHYGWRCHNPAGPLGHTTWHGGCCEEPYAWGVWCRHHVPEGWDDPSPATVLELAL